jgi:hypothetical protein
VKWSDEKMNQKQLSEYKFPKESGEFKGTLKYRKKLGNKPCILCYFLSDDNRKIVLPVWENSKTKRYSPINCECCFMNDVAENTKWECKYEVTLTANGNTNTKFLSAFMINNSAENDKFFAEKFFILLIKKAFPRCFCADLLIEKINFCDEILFKSVDKNANYCYEISKNSNGNWQINRKKISDNKEKDTVILIDNISYDIVSRNYI